MKKIALIVLRSYLMVYHPFVSIAVERCFEDFQTIEQLCLAISHLAGYYKACWCLRHYKERSGRDYDRDE